MKDKIIDIVRNQWKTETHDEYFSKILNKDGMIIAHCFNPSTENYDNKEIACIIENAPLMLDLVYIMHDLVTNDAYYNPEITQHEVDYIKLIINKIEALKGEKE